MENSANITKIPKSANKIFLYFKKVLIGQNCLGEMFYCKKSNVNE